MRGVTRPLVRPGVTCIFGQTYTGKTTLVRHELEARPRGRALIFDPSLSQSLDGLPELISRRECKRFLAGSDSRGSWIRVVRFREPRDFAWLAGTVRHWRAVTWVLDDGASLMQYDAIARVARVCAISGRHMGGRAGVELWFVGHRPIHAPPEIRSQVAAVYSFRQREPRDLALLSDWCGPEFAESVSELEEHRWVRWPIVEPAETRHRRRATLARVA